MEQHEQGELFDTRRYEVGKALGHLSTDDFEHFRLESYAEVADNVTVYPISKGNWGGHPRDRIALYPRVWDDEYLPPDAA